MTYRNTARLAGAVLTAAALAACDSGGTQEPPPTPAITVAAGASSAEVLPGGSTTMAVNVTRTGGYTGAINLSAEGAPSGVTIGAVSIPGGATTGTLNIAAAANAAPTTATVTVRASGTGVAAQTATFALTVRQPPGFSLSVTPTSVPVQLGAASTATVNIARTGGFTGAVALTATGAPAGLTVSFNPASATAGTASVSLAAGAGTAAGTHTVTIRGNAAGLAEQTATLSVVVSPAPSIGITLSPTTLSVAQGASGNVTVNLTRVGSFTGAVNLTAESLPSGVTVGSGSIAAGATSGTLTISAAQAAAAGTSNITIRAVGTGVADATAALALTVTQAAGYTLAVSPTSLSIQQGATGNASVALTRTGGFAGAVALSATGAPAGMTVSFNPASTTGTTSAVSVATTGAVGAGTYPITIRGVTTGQADRVATLNVTVTPGTQPGGNVAMRFCATDGIPIWLAAQNNTGAWTRVTPDASNLFAFQITTRGGVAYVRQNTAGAGPAYELVVMYGTTAEIQASADQTCAGGTGSARTLNGTIAGLGLTDQAFISAGGASTAVVGAQGGTFQLTDVQPGVIDLMATRMSFSLTTGGISIDRLFLQRNMNPASGATVAVDLNGANSFAPGTATGTLTNLGSDHAAMTSMYRTTNGTFGIIGMEAPSAGATRTYYGVPADRQAADEWHYVVANASAPGSDAPTHQRTAGFVFRTLADRAFAFGPNMSTVTVAVVSSSPYARLRATYPVQAEYNSWFTADFSQQTREATIQMTGAYQGGAANAILEVPDFSGVAGWDNNWGLRPGVLTNWTVMAMGWPTTGGSFINPWVENTAFRSAVRSGSITP